MSYQQVGACCASCASSKKARGALGGLRPDQVMFGNRTSVAPPATTTAPTIMTAQIASVTAPSSSFVASHLPLLAGVAAVGVLAVFLVRRRHH